MKENHFFLNKISQKKLALKEILSLNKTKKKYSEKEREHYFT